MPHMSLWLCKDTLCEHSVNQCAFHCIRGDVRGANVAWLLAQQRVKRYTIGKNFGNVVMYGSGCSRERFKMVNRVGLQLGNYRLIHLIGFGPHTEVYLGEHIYLRTQAAIKVLQIQLMGNALEDFLTGARAIGGLMHPNIVRVLDFGVENNVPFLVLDYAPNGTLRQQHPYGTRLSLETILFYVGQIAPTLQYAHDRQLFHCDIRPENMLLGSNYEIMLSDFSMALITRSLLQQNAKSVVSAIAYMAPEQIEGKPCAASDQYALGSVVYEWLCGSLPSRPLASLQKVATVSRDVEQVVLKALARDPGRRFASVAAFALALQQA